MVGWLVTGPHREQRGKSATECIVLLLKIKIRPQGVICWHLLPYSPVPLVLILASKQIITWLCNFGYGHGYGHTIIVMFHILLYSRRWQSWRDIRSIGGDRSCRHTISHLYPYLQRTVLGWLYVN